jgi:hypothetical protein
MQSLLLPTFDVDSGNATYQVTCEGRVPRLNVDYRWRQEHLSVGRDVDVVELPTELLHHCLS